MAAGGVGPGHPLDPRAVHLPAGQLELVVAHGLVDGEVLGPDPGRLEHQPRVAGLLRGAPHQRVVDVGAELLGLAGVGDGLDVEVAQRAVEEAPDVGQQDQPAGDALAEFLEEAEVAVDVLREVEDVGAAAVEVLGLVDRIDAGRRRHRHLEIGEAGLGEGHQVGVGQHDALRADVDEPPEPLDQPGLPLRRELLVAEAAGVEGIEEAPPLVLRPGHVAGQAVRIRLRQPAALPQARVVGQRSVEVGDRHVGRFVEERLVEDGGDHQLHAGGRY